MSMTEVEEGAGLNLSLSNDSDDNQVALTGTKRVAKEDDEGEESDELNNPDCLEDDDYDLLEENLGVKIKRRKRYKRVRRLSSDSDSEDDNLEGRGNGTDGASSLGSNDENERLMSRDDNVQTPEEDSDKDDFIVDEHGNPFHEYTNTRPRITDERILAVREIFGEEFDQEEVTAEAARESDDDEHSSDDDSSVSSEAGARQDQNKLKSLIEIYEPALLEDAGLTDDAEKIRVLDMPERFILRSFSVHPPASQNEIEAETGWIYNRSFKDKGNKSSIQKVIQDVICFIRKDCYEVPYIQRYKRNMYEPHLEKDDLWTIFDQDEEFCRLVERKQRLIRVFIRMQAYVQVIQPIGIRPVTDKDLDNIRGIQTLLEARDMQALFQLYYGDTAAELNEHLKAKKVELLAASAADIDPSLLDHHTLLADNSFGDDIVGGNIGVRQRKGTHAGAYRCCIKNGINEFIQRLGLGPEEFGENVNSGIKKHQTRPSKEDLKVIASNYISEKFPSPDEVLIAGRFMLARQLSKDVEVRKYVREHLNQNAKITAKPTTKGFCEIDELHYLYAVKYLRQKPMKELDPIKFLELDMGEKDQLMEIMIDASFDSHGKSFLGYLISCFQTETLEEDCIWNNYRAEIVTLAYEKFLLPESLKDLRRNILHQGHKLIKSFCVKKLKATIQVAPFGVTECEDPDNSESGTIDDHASINSEETKSLLIKRDIIIMSFTFTDNQYEPVYYSVLCPMGKTLEIGKLDYFMLNLQNSQISYNQKILKQSGVGIISNLIQKHSPELIVVSSESHLALRLFTQLQEIVNNIADLKSDINVIICDNEMSKVASKSKYYKDEFPIYSDGLREAISLGRKLLDPLLEVSQLYNKSDDILCVRLHKYQDKVPKEELMRSLERTFMDITAGVGVDINEALKYSHRASTLQFVSGLGFYRSLQIRRAFNSRDKIMENRNNLVTICKLGPLVFRNCAGFIRYDPSLLDGDAIDDNYIELLDNTPIHPETYDHARFLCSEILKDVVGQTQDATDMFGVTEPFLSKSELNMDAIKALQDVDIFTMNRQLVESNKYPDLLCIWQDIRRAILCHKADLRFKYKPPTPEQLFFMITKLDPENFYTPGKLQYGLITGFVGGVKPLNAGGNDFRQKDNRENDEPVPLRDDKTGDMICPFCDLHISPSEFNAHWINTSCQELAHTREVKIYFDNGFFGYLSRENFSDEAIGYKLRTRVTINQQICVRIMDIDYTQFLSKCSSKSSDLNNPIYMPTKDECYDWEAEVKEKKMYSEVSNKKNVLQTLSTQRLINHHYYKHLSYDQAVRELEGADSGEVLFRPSTRGSNFITLSWKVTGNIIQHIDILEEGKTHNLALGKKLLIGDVEFEDLDNIVTHFVNPLAGWVRDLVKFRYYNESQELEKENCVKEFLLRIREKNMGKIHYVISPSVKNPGTFILSYLPKDKVYQETIRMTPDGYVYRKKLFRNVNSFVDHFKQNFNLAPAVTTLNVDRSDIPKINKFSNITSAIVSKTIPSSRQPLEPLPTPMNTESSNNTSLI